MLVSLSHYQHSGHGAPEHLVSSVQAAAPHQTLHSEHSGPGEKGGGLHFTYHCTVEELKLLMLV